MVVKRLAFSIIGIAGGLTLSFLFIGRPVFAMEETPTATLYEEAYTSIAPEFISKSFSFIASASDPCLEKLYTCPVTTPTIVQPTPAKEYGYDANVLFTGLSWNETKIDIYIDGVRVGRADLRTDANGVGDFVFRTTNLKPGKHFMYAIAWNLGEWERSPKTPTVFFAIAEPASAPQLPEIPMQEETTTIPFEEEDVSTTTEQTPGAGKILDWFFNKQATSTVSTINDRVRGGTTAMVIAVATVIVLGFLIRYFSKHNNNRPGGPPLPPDQHVPSDDGSPPSKT